MDSTWKYDEEQNWNNRAIHTSTGVGKRGYNGGNAMTKQFMAATLKEPTDLVALVPDDKITYAVAKPNDLKPRALYPVDHWTTVLDSIVFNDLE